MKAGGLAMAGEIKKTTAQESLAVVERLLNELPRTETFTRLVLHLEGRREMLIKQMERECSGCTGSSNSGRNTDTKTGTLD